jgi:phosphatidylglycerol:prolipoprotein diacylglycerol transferase
MFNLLHNFNPDPLLFSIGFLKIYWYGFFIVLAFSIAFFIILFLARKYNIDKKIIVDLVFYLFIFGIIGARVYDIFLEWRYYLNNPIDVFKIWEGGLAIHGAILAGIIVVIVFIKKYRVIGQKEIRNNFFRIVSIIVPALALGQAIGRWGNYFNQELFGLPTSGFWGIFINPINRPIDYYSYSYFHPTFFYESLACFIIFIVLMVYHLVIIRKNKISFKNDFIIVSLYFILYSILRFSLEFIRIDFAPIFLGLRWPQIMSLVLILVFIILYVKLYLYKNRKNNL